MQGGGIPDFASVDLGGPPTVPFLYRTEFNNWGGRIPQRPPPVSPRLPMPPICPSAIRVGIIYPDAVKTGPTRFITGPCR